MSGYIDPVQTVNIAQNVDGGNPKPMSRKILVVYYAATVLFVSLDFGFGVNVRVAFLDSEPGLRLGYYLVCFACLALVLWQPAWTTLVGVVESLATIVALIFNIALRSMIVTDAMLETGTGFVTMPEIINFIIAGGAAYTSWIQGLNVLVGRRAGPKRL